jgi:hypothetical protein
MNKLSAKKILSTVTHPKHRYIALGSTLLFLSIVSIGYFSFAQTSFALQGSGTLSADQQQVSAGTTVNLTWNTTTVTNDPTCYANNFNVTTGNYTDYGTGTAVVQNTTTYSVTCSNGKTLSTTVTVSSAPLATITNFSTSNAQPTYGTGTTINWSTSNATSCTGSSYPSSGDFTAASGNAPSGSANVYPTYQTTYSLKCYNANGASVIATPSVTISPAPIISVFQSGTNPVQLGNGTTLTWSSSGASICTGSSNNPSSTFSTGNTTSGSVPITPGSATTYTLTCTSTGGTTASKSVTENVTSPTPLSAMCRVNPTLAQENSPVTWSASASGGTYPYNFTWGGNYAIAGDTGSSAYASYSAPGTYKGSISVTDSGAGAGSAASTNYQWGQVCTGALVSNIYSDNEDGGTQQSARLEAKSAATSYLQSLPNAQNYCVEGHVVQYCNFTAAQCLAPTGFSTFYITDDLYSGTSVGTAPTNNPNTIYGYPEYSVNDYGTGLYTPASGPTSQQSTANACYNSLVVNPPAAPTVTMTANPTSIISGNQSTLTWTSTNATSCSIDNGVGSVPPGTNQSTSVSPTDTKTYIITCFGPSSSASAPATVAVTPPAQLPDLTASLTSAEMNLTGTVGVPVNLAATVSNIGAGPTGAAFQTTFWSNTVQNESGANVQYSEFTSGVPNGFDANHSETDGPQIPITQTFSSAGTYYYQVCANLDQNWNNSVAESNYNNNCSAWGTITISPNPNPSAIGGSCSASPAIASPGTPVTWTATPSGGDGSYTYSWSGGDGLSGTNSQVQHTYNTAGNYNGQVTISDTDGNQATINCETLVAQNECQNGNCCPSGSACSGCNDPTADLCVPKPVSPTCSVDNTNPAVGGIVNYSVSPTTNGPYTWTPTPSTMCTPTGSTSGSTYSCQFNSAGGPYEMQVTDSSNQTGYCSPVTVGNGNQCTDRTPSISASPQLLPAGGGSSTIKMSNLVANSSCVLTGGPTPQTYTFNSCSPSNENYTDSSITTQTKFCVTCDSGTPQCTVVNVAPAFQNF